MKKVSSEKMFWFIALEKARQEYPGIYRNIIADMRNALVTKKPKWKIDEIEVKW